MAKRHLVPPKLINAAILVSFALTLLTSIWTVGRKVDQTLTYLNEIPKLSMEVSKLNDDKKATQQSIQLLRYETSEHLSLIRTEFSQVDTRVTNTNLNVKMELQKVNDYLLLLCENNAELKRMIMLKKDNDNRLFDHLFSQKTHLNN